MDSPPESPTGLANSFEAPGIKDGYEARTQKCYQNGGQNCYTRSAERRTQGGPDSAANAAKGPSKPAKTANASIEHIPSVEDFELLNFLGFGGNGMVVKALTRWDSKIVAIKMLRKHSKKHPTHHATALAREEQVPPSLTPPSGDGPSNGDGVLPCEQHLCIARALANRGNSVALLSERETFAN